MAKKEDIKNGVNITFDGGIIINDKSLKEEEKKDKKVVYAMYTLSKCDSLIASGMSNGVDLIRCFNGGNFQNDYQFSVGVKQ